jgi:hypothetical protein
MPLLGAVVSVGEAAPVFVNGVAIPGDTLDVSGGVTANNGRVGFFSDIFYDRTTGQWWGLSDRGPGGGSLHYATRVQRFDLQIDVDTGTISDYAVLETVIFKHPSNKPLDGIAPNPINDLGRSFDPEGFVVLPGGHFVVSDEYGPSLYEFDADGKRVGVFGTPENLVPRHEPNDKPNYASDDGNNAGKRTNRGFEGLAVSPEGDFVYAMLQSAMLDEGAGDGVCNRIVKFNTATRAAVAQYAYKMEGSSQGRGISALLALNDHEFLVLERNNRGVGVGADASPPNKKVFRIDIAGAPDVSAVVLTNANCADYDVAKNTTPFLDIAANTLPAIGNKVPEKWEGLAIGPQLADGSSYLMLAGTDNDYSVTQNASGIQFDVYFRFSDADSYAASIQCPLDTVVNCFRTDTGDPVTLPADSSYKLLPGILHSYKVPAADLGPEY